MENVTGKLEAGERPHFVCVCGGRLSALNLTAVLSAALQFIYEKTFDQRGSKLNKRRKANSYEFVTVGRAEPRTFPRVAPTYR